MIDWPAVTSGAVVQRRPASIPPRRNRTSTSPVGRIVMFCALGLAAVVGAASYAISIWPRQPALETSATVGHRDPLTVRSTTSELVAESQTAGRRGSFAWELPPGPAPELARPAIPDPPAYRISLPRAPAVAR